MMRSLLRLSSDFGFRMCVCERGARQILVREDQTSMGADLECYLPLAALPLAVLLPDLRPPLPEELFPDPLPPALPFLPEALAALLPEAEAFPEPRTRRPRRPCPSTNSPDIR